VDQLLDRIRHRRIGGLFQHRELGLDVAHGASLEQFDDASK
jgi:hypothetical protein